MGSSSHGMRRLRIGMPTLSFAQLWNEDGLRRRKLDANFASRFGLCVRQSELLAELRLTKSSQDMVLSAPSLRRLGRITPSCSSRR
jgi:hypothetical protein